MQTQLGVNCPVFNDKSYSSLPGIEAGWGEGGWIRRYLPQRENFVMLLGRQEEGRELFLLLLILNCLRLKIILMLKWRILGWHILNSFMSVAVGGSSRNGKFLSIKQSTLSHIFFFFFWTKLCFQCLCLQSSFLLFDFSNIEFCPSYSTCIHK